MTGTLLFVVFVFGLCVAGLLGGGLFLIGMISQDRTRKRSGLIVGVTAFVLLVGCLIYSSVRAVGRFRGTDPGKVWKSAVDAWADDTNVQSLEHAEAHFQLCKTLGDPAVLRDTIVEGIWVKQFLDYGYFIYTADEQELLKAVAQAPLVHSSEVKSDVKCNLVSWESIEAGMFAYRQGPQRNLAGWNPESVSDKRCYSCLRFPWIHEIVVDAKTGKIYHAVSSMRD